MKNTLAGVVVILFSLAIGCGEVGISWSLQSSEPFVPDAGDGWLMFELRPVEKSGAVQKFDCTFQAEGKTAHFQFQLTTPEGSEDPSIAFTSGELIAVPGSDASVFLRKLQKTLEAKTFPIHPERLAELPFTAAILGRTRAIRRTGDSSPNLGAIGPR